MSVTKPWQIEFRADSFPWWRTTPSLSFPERTCYLLGPFLFIYGLRNSEERLSAPPTFIDFHTINSSSSPSTPLQNLPLRVFSNVREEAGERCSCSSRSSTFTLPLFYRSPVVATSGYNHRYSESRWHPITVAKLTSRPPPSQVPLPYRVQQLQ